jgi:chitosanase
MNVPRKDTIWAILDVFETGRLSLDRYSSAEILPDNGGISYGRHQATSDSGTLASVLRAYLTRGGNWEGDPSPSALLSHIEATEWPRSGEPTPSWARASLPLLQEAGTEVPMQEAQDYVFEQDYWLPAVSTWTDLGLRTALGLLVIYDTWIHSGAKGVGYIRPKFPELPPSKGGGEKAWVTAYVQARGAWLRAFDSAAVRASTYRTDSLARLIEEERWDLEPPFRLLKPSVLIPVLSPERTEEKVQVDSLPGCE